MNKLIKMEDYVLDLCREIELHNTINFVNRVHDYAQLLKSKPTLSMFIPCDDNGNVLEEPKNPKLGVSEMKYYDKYVEAKSKVIFDGWSVEANVSYLVLIKDKNDNNIGFYKDGIVRANTEQTINTISDLIPYNLKLK